MESIYGGTDPFADCFWPEVTPSDTHAVLYELPLPHDGQPPKPHRTRGGYKWDQTHVRMPCSPESVYPALKSDGSTELVSRWDLIQTALLERPINNSMDLQLAIFSYNSKYAKSWNFQGLHCFFENEIEESDANLFFSVLLPKIIRLALELPTILPSSIPLLKSGQNLSISMTQQQIACLMANAFLCTFPLRNSTKKNSEYSHFPDINFNRLYYSTQESVMEKLKCICNYFRRVTASVPPIGVVTFRRRSLPPKLIPKFSESPVELQKCKLLVRATGTIETDGKGLLQVDFANKIIGGGVLGQGCVQEEIRFMICPELLITRLFTEMLRPDEALFIIGAEQFSAYSGYASSFAFVGNYKDPTPLDGNQRRQCQIVAIDALPFRDPKHQYRPELMLRELTKAHVGYGRSPAQQRVAPGVASGNWGCGAFNGDAHLKSLLQLMVCAVAGRPLVYFTFGDHGLVADLQAMYKEFCVNRVTVGDLWRILEKFSKGGNLDGDELFDFIKAELKAKRKEEVKSTVESYFRPESRTWSWSKEPKREEEKKSTPFVSTLFYGAKKKETSLLGTTKTARDYSDTDDEMQEEQERKKKMNSSVGSGGAGPKEKLQRMSLLDGLELLSSKDSQGKKSCPSTSSCGIGSLVQVAGSSEVDMVAEKEEDDKNNNKKLPPTDPGVASEEMETETETVTVATKSNSAVQVDENGDEFIPPSPTAAPARTPKRNSGTKQTLLRDFFRSNNK